MPLAGSTLPLLSHLHLHYTGAVTELQALTHLLMQNVQGILEMVKKIGCRVMILEKEMGGEEGVVGSSAKGRRGTCGRASLLCPAPRTCFPPTTVCEFISMLESKLNARPLTVVRDRPARRLEPLTRVKDGDILPKAWSQQLFLFQVP